MIGRRVRTSSVGDALNAIDAMMADLQRANESAMLVAGLDVDVIDQFLHEQREQCRVQRERMRAALVAAVTQRGRED